MLDRPTLPEIGESLTRRKFLQSSAVAVSLTGVSQLVGAEKEKKRDIIDAHSHIWTTDVENYPLQKGQTVADLEPRSFTPTELMAIAAPHGVTKVVLIQHNIFHAFDNSYISDTIQKEPKKYSGVARVRASGKNPVRKMNRLRKLGTRGLRIVPSDGGKAPWRESEGMNAMWKRGAEIGVALCPLINPKDLSEVDFMCQKYPDTTVVIDHFARIGIDGMIHRKDLDHLLKLAKHSKAHVKVSAYYALGNKKPPHDELIPMIKELYEAYGPERLMWASDCPYQLTGPNTYGDSIALIQDRIDFLSEADKDWILYKTAESVFFA